MAVSIGKRKREHDDDGANADSEDESAMRALFQRAFEAKFKPLPPAEVPNRIDQLSESNDSREDSADSEEWDGLSDEDESVEVICINQPSSDAHLDLARERRTFMVRPRTRHIEPHANASRSHQNRHHQLKSLSCCPCQPLLLRKTIQRKLQI